jgi:succinate dehydrogenase hydrophobic anchor subunit
LRPTPTVALLGAIRESLTNAMKHGHTTHVVVFISGSSDLLKIVIRDHGDGFNPTTTPRGFGLTYSIAGRVAELDGHTKIWSAPNEGTRVELLVPMLAVTGGGRVATSHGSSSETTSDGPPSARALVTRGLKWFAVAALAYRLGLSPLQVGGAIATLGFSASVLFSAAMSVVLLYDACLLLAAIRGRIGWLLHSNIFYVVDVIIAISLNLWAAASLPSNSIFLPSREVFWAYMLGIIALWTGLRGARAGLTLVALGPAVLTFMAFLNHSKATTAEWNQALAEEAWLVAAFVISWILSILARQGVRVAVAEAMRAGQAEERAKALRHLQEDVVYTLDEIVKICQLEISSKDQLRRIRGLALAQVSDLRAALDQRDLIGLIGELQAVASEFMIQGLRIELVSSELSQDPPDDIIEFLTRAVREALSIALSDADPTHVIIHVSFAANKLQLVIRDRALMPPESASEHEERLIAALSPILREVGGKVEVNSSSTSGTRVRISLSVDSAHL